MTDQFNDLREALKKFRSSSHRGSSVPFVRYSTLALRHVPDDEHRPELAIAMAEQYALGDESVTLDDVRDAAADAADAYAAYAAYAARTKVLAECADLVRRMYPTPPRMP